MRNHDHDPDLDRVSEVQLLEEERSVLYGVVEYWRNEADDLTKAVRFLADEVVRLCTSKQVCPLRAEYGGCEGTDGGRCDYSDRDLLIGVARRHGNG